MNIVQGIFHVRKRRKKTEYINNIVKIIKQNGGRFLVQENDSRRVVAWHLASDGLIHEKIGKSLRDALKASNKQDESQMDTTNVPQEKETISPRDNDHDDGQVPAQETSSKHSTIDQNRNEKSHSKLLTVEEEAKRFVAAQSLMSLHDDP